MEQLPRVELRNNGYARGGTLRGDFRLEEGPARLFIEVDRPPFLILRPRLSQGSPLIVNWPDPQRTRRVYAQVRRLRGK